MGKHALSGLLAALIAFPMYYMFYSIFTHGFEGGPFLTAAIIALTTFVITVVIASLIARQGKKAA